MFNFAFEPYSFCNDITCFCIVHFANTITKHVLLQLSVVCMDPSMADISFVFYTKYKHSQYLLNIYFKKIIRVLCLQTVTYTD